MEIGCGEGELASELTARGFSVTAIDRECRTEFPLQVTAFEDFDAKGTRYDAVIAMLLVLHHVHHMQAFLRKAASLLKPAGFLAIDDYGWQLLDGPTAKLIWPDNAARQLHVFREDRADLHTSGAMLDALNQIFDCELLERHPYFDEGHGPDEIGFSYVGRPRVSAGIL